MDVNGPGVEWCIMGVGVERSSVPWRWRVQWWAVCHRCGASDRVWESFQGAAGDKDERVARYEKCLSKCTSQSEMDQPPPTRLKGASLPASPARSLHSLVNKYLCLSLCNAEWDHSGELQIKPTLHDVHTEPRTAKQIMAHSFRRNQIRELSLWGTLYPLLPMHIAVVYGTHIYSCTHTRAVMVMEFWMTVIRQPNNRSQRN